MELKGSDLATLARGLPSNQSVTHLDISGNQVSKQHFHASSKFNKVWYNSTA